MDSRSNVTASGPYEEPGTYAPGSYTDGQQRDTRRGVRGVVTQNENLASVSKMGHGKNNNYSKFIFQPVASDLS